MKWVYRCPHCQAHLNPGSARIALLAERNDGKGLFFFGTSPGDYSLDVPLDIDVKAGSLWEFSCPVCRANLTSEANDKIAMIRLFDEDGKEHAVFFSKVAKEHCTFVVTAEGVEAFGPDVSLYEGMVWAKYF